MKIRHLNVRSLVSGFNLLVILIKSHNFAIFGINESWLSEEVVDEAVAMPGYQISGEIGAAEEVE